MRFLKFSPLSIKLLVLALAASLAAFLIVTGTVFLQQRTRLFTEAHAAAEATVAQNTQALSRGLWTYDEEILHSILAGMVQSGPLVGARIVEHGTPLAEETREGGRGGIDRRWQVELRAPGGAVIGELQLDESYAAVRGRMLAEAQLFAIAELFQIIGLAAVLIVIVYRLVTRHLSALAGKVRAMNVADGPDRIALSRANHVRDELDELVDALNRFRSGQAEEQRRRTQAEHSLRERMAEIEHRAFHDALTGLGNRSMLTQKLAAEIERARPARGRVAVFYVDLDNFKNINDNFGHEVGDALLRQLGARLRTMLPPAIWATRQGGDEFIVVAPVPEGGDPVKLAERLMQLIRQPYPVDSAELLVSCSVGISLFPEHGELPNELVGRADMAMFAAKTLGRNTCSLFDETLRQRVRERLTIADALKTALRSDELSLAYQPVIDLCSGRIVAAEALLRWNSARLGPVSPAVFIPIAEETGLIVEIGDWVVREAVASAMRWRRDGTEGITLAVNVSALQFESGRFMATLRDLGTESPECPRLLTLEITETALAGNIGALRENMRTIRDLGYRIAIDDFGTGYSSLSYLKDLPVDTLKIDREFVRDLHENPRNVDIVSAIIQLGKSLQCEIVAEGTESPQGIRILRDLRCDRAQGFYYSMPVSEAQLLSLLPQAFAVEDPAQI